MKVNPAFLTCMMKMTIAKTSFPMSIRDGSQSTTANRYCHAVMRDSDGIVISTNMARGPA